MARRAPAVLEVDLSREIVEAPSGPRWFSSGAPTLFEVEESIHRAASDSKIAGLLLKLDFPDLGWSKAESLNRAIRTFRATGKPSLAFVSRGGSAPFLVAAAAERVVIEPSTTLDVQSLSSQTFFLKDVLGELGVDPEIDQVGEYKSAGEIFLRTESSAAHREQIDEILKGLQELLVTAVAEGRGLAVESARASLERGPFLPEEAIACGFVDGTADLDELEKLMEERLGSKPRLVSWRRYLRRGRLRRFFSRSRFRRIAVVHAVGVITLGEGRQSMGATRTAGARSLTDVLAGLRESPRVKAVVVRVDSPGGGAVASDRIRRELQAIAKVKPVVVSMGDVAASGGYYLATAADFVVAEASTLTGSIGVIGGKFVVTRLLDRLGIHRELRAAGANPGFYSSLRHFTAEERARNRDFMSHFYEKKFIPAVAAGRKLGLTDAEKLGRGRVWTGRQAHERGLVDRLGGLHDAIDVACSRAGVARARARVTFVAPRRRLRDVLPALASDGAPSTLGVLREALLLAEELTREELLLLMPQFYRIR